MNSLDRHILKLKLKRILIGSPVYRFIYVWVGTPIRVAWLIIKALRGMVERVRMGMTLEKAAPRAANSVLRDEDKRLRDMRDENYLLQRRLDRIKAELETE